MAGCCGPLSQEDLDYYLQVMEADHFLCPACGARWDTIPMGPCPDCGREHLVPVPVAPGESHREHIGGPAAALPGRRETSGRP